MVASVKLLDDIYRTEKNVDVRESLLLVRRVLVDNDEQAARVAEKEFHRSWQADTFDSQLPIIDRMISSFRAPVAITHPKAT